MNRRLALALSVVATLGACASGPKYSEVQQSFPALGADHGRIYFFRSSSMLGAAIQPAIWLNGEVVGQSQPGSFFFVDRAAGEFVASTSTETEKTASFALAAGETKYIRSSPSLGVLIGRINLSPEDPATAKAEIETLAYIGPKR